MYLKYVSNMYLKYSRLHRFGIKFFKTFISLSPARQVDGLFSGCYNILENDTDIKDCLKIFLTSLTKLSNIKSYSYML